jgi:membrane protein DedA with SNARE-associated domain
MPNISTGTLTHLIATYGYLAVFIGVGIESMGIPFPGETILLVASIYAGTSHQLSIFLVIVAAAAGAIVGDNIGFWIGREGGFRLVRRYGHLVGLTERRLKLGQYLFLKHGGKVVFFGRFVAILRAWAAFLAGTNRMPWPRFLFFNGLGGMVWATIYGLGGYILGSNVYRIRGTLGVVFAIAAVIAVIALLIVLRNNEQRLEDEAERALPGPIERYYSGSPQ